jgi:hypothetical protein
MRRLARAEKHVTLGVAHMIRKFELDEEVMARFSEPTKKNRVCFPKNGCRYGGPSSQLPRAEPCDAYRKIESSLEKFECERSSNRDNALETDPKKHVTIMSAANKVHNSDLVPLVKMLKAWNKTHARESGALSKFSGRAELGGNREILSIRQPRAHLIVHGTKDIEYR